MPIAFILGDSRKKPTLLRPDNRSNMLSKQRQRLILLILVQISLFHIIRIYCGNNDSSPSPLNQDHFVTSHNNNNNNNYNYNNRIKNLKSASGNGAITNSSISSSSELQHTNGSAAVDDILNDTILLLDELDHKLEVVNNRTPNAMMRDKLRALDHDYELQLEHQIRSDNQWADQELEDALVKLADGFAPGRGAEDKLSVAASDNESELVSQILNQSETSPLNGHSLSSSSSTSSSFSSQSQSPPPSSSSSSISSSLIPKGGPMKKSRQLNNNNNHHQQQQQQQQHIQAALLDDNQLASDSTERHIKFTLDLMQSIFSSQSYSSKTNLIESFLISPLSIQMVLMMMHLGARGQTKREISNCLHLSTSSSNSIQLEKILGTIVSQQQQPTQNVNSGEFSLQASKLKRRHQQQQQLSMESSGKQQQQQQQQQQQTSVNGKQQQTSNARQQSGSAHHQQQQQQQTSTGSTTNIQQPSNAHELFGAAIRNLLKDPIVMKALTSANQIFLQKNLPLSPQFEWAIKHYYAADVNLVDFQHQSSASGQQQTNSASSQTSGASMQLNTNEKGKLHSNSGATAEYSNSTLANSTNTNGAASSEQQANNIQQIINDWVERQTKGKISNFLSSPISTSTLLMAINVLYFKGDWQYKFDPADTESEAWFTQANGKTVKVPMLVNRLPLAFAHDPIMKTSVIELPYKAQRLGLFLLLPDEISGIFHTMQMLNSTSFANLISSMRKPSPTADQGASGINIRIPKFSIESSPRLSQILSQHMGLKSLFMPDSADLSGMFAPSQSYKTPSNGNSTQYNIQVGLDELLHKAVLQVDEQGSVAAASSATIVERVGLFNSNYFEADHPFLLFLMDKQTGLVLFSGAFAGNNINKEETQHQH